MIKSDYAAVVVIALLCFVNTSWCQDTMNNEDTNMTGGFEELIKGEKGALFLLSNIFVLEGECVCCSSL